MARIVPVNLSETKLKGSKLIRVTLPRKLVEDPDFSLDPKRELYARIVKKGILLTHDVNGEE